MVEKYDVDINKLHGGDYQEWASESFDDAVNLAYKPFVPGQDPDDEYKANAEPVARSRIMYGGARLADLMVQIFGDASKMVFLQ